MEAIITGGNSSFFPILKVFVESLRGQAQFQGEVYLCDNVIEGSWDKPGKFVEGGSFSPEQLTFFKDHGVQVIRFDELLTEAGIGRERIDRIPTKHWAYPGKFIYCALISKRFLEKAERICFFDADMYFQKPIDDVWQAFRRKAIAWTPERTRIADTPMVAEWVGQSDFSFGTDNEYFTKRVSQSVNYCSGFFGGYTHTFHAFSVLCWTLATSSQVTFHSDQPLLNILNAFFDFPFQDLGKDIVLHLGDLADDEIDFDPETKLYRHKGVTPSVVHFNGGKRHFLDYLTGERPAANSALMRGVERMTKKVMRGIRSLL